MASKQPTPPPEPKLFVKKTAELGRRLETLGKAMQNSDTTIGELVSLAEACRIGIRFSFLPDSMQPYFSPPPPPPKK